MKLIAGPLRNDFCLACRAATRVTGRPHQTRNDQKITEFDANVKTWKCSNSKLYKPYVKALLFYIYKRCSREKNLILWRITSFWSHFLWLIGLMILVDVLNLCWNKFNMYITGRFRWACRIFVIIFAILTIFSIEMSVWIKQ